MIKQKKLRSPQDYAVFPSSYKAGDVTRTRDLLITNELHYQLCYTSITTINIVP